MPTAPASPPKRMTRARAAKAIDTTETTTKTSTTKVMTPAAKEAAATRKAKRAAAPIDDEEDELLAEAAANTTRNATVTAAPASHKMAIENTVKSAPKRRGRAASEAEESVVEEPEEVIVVKRGRGRPRKTPVVEEQAAEEPEPTTTAASRAKPTATVSAPPRRPANNKKKVSFQEGKEAEKENEPLPGTKAAEVPELKETGIRAKPTRRPAAARATAKKTAPVVVPAGGPEKNAAVDNMDSCDELGDMEVEVKMSPAKEETKDVHIVSTAPSPAKINTTADTTLPAPSERKASSPAKEQQKEAPLPATIAASAKKVPSSALFGTPARRPARSPLKSTMKDSLHKPAVSSFALGQSSLNTPAKESMMSKSSKRFTISTVERKPSVLAAPPTDFRRSLFSSPPKRPFSPYKSTAPPSAIKSGISLMGAMTAASHKPSPLISNVTPARIMVASSAFSSQRSPAASAKVHKMTPEEREAMMKSELQSAPSPFTPWGNRPAKTPKDQRAVYRNELKNAPAPFTPKVERPQYSRVTSTGSVCGKVTNALPIPRVEAEVTTEDAVDASTDESLEAVRGAFERSTTPDGFPPEVITQSAAPSYGDNYREMNLDSDDELQLTTSTAKLTITPKHTAQQAQATPATQAPKTPSSYRRATLSSQNKMGPMTALANRFGDWKTATPDQKVVEHRKQERALFSVAKPVKRTVPVTPVAARLAHTPRTQQTAGPMTALAQKFGDWKGATPDAHKKNVQRSLFSPAKPSTALAPRTPSVATLQSTPMTTKPPITVMADKFRVAQAAPGTELDVQSPEKQSYFDEAMAIMEDDSMMVDSRPARESIFRASQISDASQLYGDENASPDDEDQLMLDASDEQVVVVTAPAVAASPFKAVITPARLHEKQPRVVHTVTKVPLKPSSDYNESPSKRPIKRSHSLSGPVSPQSAKDIRALREIPLRFDSSPIVPRTKSNVPVITAPETPEQAYTARTPSLAAAVPSPIRTPRPDLNSRLLAGAVVYVDVHTTEGADASGIFIELLNNMGGRCVKQWSWNPDASASGDTDVTEGSEENKRVGITHVVFKDGGKRTMEKVRAAGGVVSCVGVAWVLDCERENKWLDEAPYAVDMNCIPRGGHRRRKSMEPKILTGSRASLAPTASPFKAAQPEHRSALSSPSEGRTPSRAGDDNLAPATPQTYVDASFYGDSPTTPYFLHPQQLVQRTCPPKQTQQSMFSGQTEDGDRKKAAAVKQRLALMRRRSLQYQPSKPSPLGMGVGV